MADNLEAVHMNAGLDLLRAAGLTVYPDADGNVPLARDRAETYVLAYVSIERPTGGASNRINGDSDTWITRYYCHCVGPNEYSAGAIAGRVRVAMLDVTPAMAGRTPTPIRQDADQPTQRDESTGTAVYDRVVVYRLRTSP